MAHDWMGQRLTDLGARDLLTYPNAVPVTDRVRAALDAVDEPCDRHVSLSARVKIASSTCTRVRSYARPIGRRVDVFNIRIGRPDAEVDDIVPRKLSGHQASRIGPLRRRVRALAPRPRPRPVCPRRRRGPAGCRPLDHAAPVSIHRVRIGPCPASPYPPPRRKESGQFVAAANRPAATEGARHLRRMTPRHHRPPP